MHMEPVIMGSLDFPRDLVRWLDIRKAFAIFADI